MSAHVAGVAASGRSVVQGGPSAGQADQDALGKEQWVRYHADHMLQRWLARQTPLGVASDYVLTLERELSEWYEQPLLRTFIEQTYR